MSELTNAPNSWRRSVRWFAAEFLVVVSGILVALALQSWYNSRRDAASERTYMQQLDAELAMNQQQLRVAIREDSTRAVGHNQLIAAMVRPGPLSPDSARQWLRWQLGYYSDPRPLVGTVTTLIGTGDIKLIRDPALRSQIVAYASLMATDMDELSRNVTRMTQASDVERRSWERLGALPITGTSHTSILDDFPDELVTAFLPRYQAVWPQLKADPELRAAYRIRLQGVLNRVFYLRRMLESTDELRRKLAAAH